MALKSALQQKIFLALAAMTFVSTIANAYIVPGDRPPRYPGPGRPHEPRPPVDPSPYDPPTYPGEQEEIRTIIINRQVQFEQIPIDRMINLHAMQGLELTMVEVETLRTDYRDQVALLINRQNVDQQNAREGFTELFPAQDRIVGFDLHELDLSIQGSMYIGRVILHFQPGVDGGIGRPDDGIGRPDRPPYDRDLQNVFVPVNRTFFGIDRLDIGQYVSLRNFVGQRLEAIEVVADARFNNAIIDLMINGFQVGYGQSVGPQMQTIILYPGANQMIGRGADSILLLTRGDVTIHSLNLRISRR